MSSLLKRMSLPPFTFPGGPEWRRGDETLEAELYSEQAALESVVREERSSGRDGVIF
jgi:hypothetical protein